MASLDAAIAKLEPVFPQVLYGNVYLSNHLQKGKAAWYVSGHDKFYLDVKAQKRFNDVYTILHELGHRYDYQFLDKGIKQRCDALSTRRVYEKVLFDEARRTKVADETVALVKAKLAGQPTEPMSTDLVMWLKGPYIKGGEATKLTSAFAAGKITEAELHDGIKGTQDADMMTGQVLQGPLLVTPYGGTNTRENFAEAFAHYVLDMPMPEEFKALLAETAAQ